MIDPDALLPNPHAIERHSRRVHASCEVTRRAITEVDLSGSLVVRALLFARGLWGRHLKLSDLTAGSFHLLLDEPDGLALAIRGRFWRLKPDVAPATSLEDVPGTALALWTFTVEPDGDACMLRTETRIRAADEDARRRFLRYWRVVGRFSGVIRTRALALIAAQAERGN